MRTRIFSLLVVTALSLSSFALSPVNFEINRGEPSYCLAISGKVLTDKKTNRNKVRIFLIRNNVAVDSLRTNVNVVFSFQLEKDQEYFIKIIEPGSVNRLVSISTRLPKKMKKNIFFEFHFDLVPFTPAPSISPGSDVLDFPVALIYYDSKKGSFVYNKQYTTEIKKDL